MSKAFRYLFPRRKPQEKLPLLPTRPSAPYSRYGAPPDHLKPDIDLLIGLGLASTPDDAYVLLKRYKGMAVFKIAKLERRHRRQRPWWWRTWQRIKAMW